jgi:anti-sigma factor RsiW
MTVCSGIREQLELALLTGDELSSGVSAHLSTCAACAAEATQISRLIAAVAALPAPQAPADLAARITPAVLAAARPASGRLARPWRMLVGVAASFAFMVAALATAGGVLIASAALTAPKGSTTPLTTPSASGVPTTTPATTPASTPAATDEVATESEGPAPTGGVELPRRTPAPTPAPTETAAPESPAPSVEGSVAP